MSAKILPFRASSVKSQKPQGPRPAARTFLDAREEMIAIIERKRQYRPKRK